MKLTTTIGDEKEKAREGGRTEDAEELAEGEAGRLTGQLQVLLDALDLVRGDGRWLACGLVKEEDYEEGVMSASKNEPLRRLRARAKNSLDRPLGFLWLGHGKEGREEEHLSPRPPRPPRGSDRTRPTVFAWH